MGDINLSSVNFEHGMLLTPGHLLRQEQYFDSALLWMLRYGSGVCGLVGGGPRLPETERGGIRHDPVVTVIDEEEHVGVTVSQCRGISPSGCIVDIDPEHPISQRFAKNDLEGVASANVYVVCRPHEKELLNGTPDEWNPHIQTERRLRYSLSLQAPPDQHANSLVVGRVRRSQHGTAFEKEGSFIPPCTTMSGFSELMAGWRRLVEEAEQLTERYVELCRAMQEFLILFKERGIEAEVDVEAHALAGRMLAVLQNCYYDLLDSSQPPQQFFGYLRRLFHSCALQLDLSPQVQGYLEMLRDAGEPEFISLLEGQRRVVRAGFRPQTGDDLASELRHAIHAFGELRRLERALEGKYLDFRINRSLESMNFVFDRGGKVLYRLAARPARVQGIASDMIVTFSQLRLEGRDKYRLILVSERGATFEPGMRISVELRINEGAGFRRQPVLLSAESKLPEQCNLEFDFDAPDVPTISDLRVTIASQYPVRTTLLYVRQRFYAQADPGERAPARELQSTLPEEPPYWRTGAEMSARVSSQEPLPSQAPPRRRRLE